MDGLPDCLLVLNDQTYRHLRLLSRRDHLPITARHFPRNALKLLGGGSIAH